MERELTTTHRALPLYDMAIAAHHYRPSAKLILPAEPMTVALARNHIRNWLEQGDWPEGEFTSIHHMINEAVGDAIECTYPARRRVVEITMAVDPFNSDQAQHPRVLVRDHGRWQPIKNSPQGTVGEIRLTTDSMNTVILYRNHGHDN